MPVLPKKGDRPLPHCDLSPGLHSVGGQSPFLGKAPRCPMDRIANLPPASSITPATDPRFASTQVESGKEETSAQPDRRVHPSLFAQLEQPSSAARKVPICRNRRVRFAPIVPIDPPMTGLEAANAGCDATEPPNCPPRRQRVRLKEPVGFAAGYPISHRASVISSVKGRACCRLCSQAVGFACGRRSSTPCSQCSCSADCLSLAAARRLGGRVFASRPTRGSTRRKPRSRTARKFAVHTVGQIPLSVRAGTSSRLRPTR